jgi:nucleoside-diphosphate-sugar epimerase
LKILLTGASGFVGSHVLDRLCAAGIPTVVLLRPTSDRQAIEAHLPKVELRIGSISEPGTLMAAVAGITHVIHCAGCVKALSKSDFFEVNETGTRNLVEAFNSRGAAGVRFVHVSSLAAAGPSRPGSAVCESDTPRPVSDYGRSKLAGELRVRDCCRREYVILRPPAVYGPGDLEFLRLFRSVKAHLAPRPAPQPLSLVYVRDLAGAIVRSLEAPAVGGKTYFVACEERVTARTMARAIAENMGVWTVPLPVPLAFLWTLCLLQEGVSRFTGRPNVLSLGKYAELRAPGWVCDPGLLKREAGIVCPTPLHQGIRETLTWYRHAKWL